MNIDLNKIKKDFIKDFEECYDVLTPKIKDEELYSEFYKKYETFIDLVIKSNFKVNESVSTLPFIYIVYLIVLNI